MPLSPSFPDWLLKRDPTLAGALTNPLFLAFETRRGRQGRSRFGILGFYHEAVRLVLVILLPILAFSIAVVAGPFALIGLVITALIGWVYFPRLLPRFRSEMVIPGTLTEVIRGRIYLPILTDIWVCPVTNGEFFEALILESRRGAHIRAALKAICLYVFCLSAFSAGLSIFSPYVKGGELIIATMGLFMLIFFVPASARMYFWSDALRTIEEVDGRLRLSTPSNAGERQVVSVYGCVGCFYAAMVAFGWLIAFGWVLPVISAANWAGGILGLIVFVFISNASASGNCAEYSRLLHMKAEDHSLLIRRLRAATLEASPASPPGISP